MSELEVIKYLISELEQEIDKKKNYDYEVEIAKRKSQEIGEKWWWRCLDYSVKKPKKSIVIGNTKKIRELCLKLRIDLLNNLDT